MASTFRASPWVTYQPHAQAVNPQPSDPAGTTMIMDMDVDMDAPQISTLREEVSPPPTKKAGASRKLKALKLKVVEPGPHTHPERKLEGADGEEQAEDEEDQLIDDDNPLAQPSSATLPAPLRSPESTPKKKPGPKRKLKKESDDSNDLNKSSEKASSGALSLAPTMSWFKADPSTSHTLTGTPEASSHIAVEGASAPPEPIILKLSTAGKRKQASPRKTASTPRGRGRGAKLKTTLVPHYVEDVATSEAGYTGTGSSPATALMGLPDIDVPGSPEVENTTVAPSSPPIAPIPPAEEATSSLEGVAVPQYPLPTKPFPVQPPVKIATGFAPPIPLDRSTKKVRRWRTANREIRGIAGGRWFAHSWVGDKESEYAKSPGDDRILLPGGASLARLAGLSASAPPGKARGRGSKAASAVASAVPSRSGSAGPEGAPNVIRPTKMRILQFAPSDNGDSDMAPPDS